MNASNTNAIQAIETATWNDPAIQENFWRVDEICDYCIQNSIAADVEFKFGNSDFYDSNITRIGETIYINDGDYREIFVGFTTIDAFVKAYAETLEPINRALFLESYGIKAIYEFDELELCKFYTTIDSDYSIIDDYKDVSGEMIQDLASGSDQYFCNGDQDVYIIDERLLKFKYIEI